MKTLLAASLGILVSTAALAVSPVGSDKFNTDPGFDLSKLTAENFYSVIVPLAKKEGSLTFYDFTDSFGKLFNDQLIPDFEAKYGVKVNYIRGDAQAAIQQLIAAHTAHSKSPADAYFVSSANVPILTQSGIIANIPLTKLLPNGAALDPKVALVTGGVQHGGAYLPFHRNQTAIVFDTRSVPPASVPGDFDALLAWAKANPHKFIITSLAGGGSGTGFAQSLAYAKVTGAECRATLANYAITKPEAVAYAAGPCMTPVWNYYKEILPVSEVTNGNSDTLTLVANGAGSIGTAWEDMTYDFVGRGLLPPSVRLELVKEGQVGGGDGMFLPVDGKAPASALLLLDFMMSKEVQLKKLQINGSRSARTDIDPAASFTPQQVSRLIPTDQFASRSKQNMPSALNSALVAYVMANLLNSN
jgi:ABC-type uncharacterized transport system YnjBCD substrate-binding protein